MWNIFGFLRILCFTFVINCASGEWYRELPNEDDGRIVKGIWEKKTNPRSAINSSWHKYTWSEELRFHFSERRFERIFSSREKIANKERFLTIKGSGIYYTHKNWILLKLETLDIMERNGDSILKEQKKSKSDLLYYYYEPGNLLIPMIHDRGFEEKNFGVKDGTKEPFLENENFFTYVKIYAFKDYQPHAYFLRAGN